MTLGERIKRLRKEKELTQQEFCEKIGLKRNSISLVESGKRNISDQAIKSICREFNVDETWLRTGAGEMFQPSPNSALDALAQEYGLSQFGRTVIEKMANLSEKQWTAFYAFAMDVVSSMSEAPAAPVPEPEAPAGKIVPPGYSSREELEQEADEFAAMAREQFLSEKRREMSASSAKESGAG